MSQFKQQSVLTSHKNKKTSNPPPLIILKVTVVYNEPSVSCPLDRKRENSKVPSRLSECLEFLIEYENAPTELMSKRVILYAALKNLELVCVREPL